jgi:rubredoxin
MIRSGVADLILLRPCTREILIYSHDRFPIMTDAGGPYKCTICNWIYDPLKGYPKGGAEPGTAFKDLPEDFRCPECGAKLKWFEACGDMDG